MAYTPITWMDRAVQYAKRYFLRDNGGSDKNLLPPFNEGWTLHENTRMKQANYVGKVSGSTVANPHISKNTATSTLTSPAVAWFAEETDGQYATMSTLNGTITTHSNGTNGNMIQQLFSFNLIEHVIRNYGVEVFGVAVTTAERVAWLKVNVTKLTGNWYGYGSGPAGNKATLSFWNASSSVWATASSHTSGSVTKISRTDNSMTSIIDSNGFYHLLSYADASNGTIASTINTDFVELEIYMAAGSIPQADYELTLNATSTDQVSDYINIPVLPNTQYTFSQNGANKWQINQYSDLTDSTLVPNLIGSLYIGTNTSITLTTASNAKYLILRSRNAATGLFTFSNPQLELGSVATAFAPMKTYDVTQAPGIVTQAGTPINAANLNALEQGVANSAQRDIDNNFSANQTIAKNDATVTVNATTGNPILFFRENGGARGYIFYNTATDSLYIRLIDVDGATEISSITMSATATSFTDPLAAPGGTFTGDLTVSKATATIIANATSGNAVYRLRENGSDRGWLLYEVASDSIKLRLIDTDGVTNLNEITLSAGATTFSDPINAPGGTMTGDVTVSKATADIISDATSGNANFTLKENGSNRGRLAYAPSIDTLLLRLYGTDGTTVLNEITLSDTSTTFTEPITAPTAELNGGVNVLALKAGASADHAYMSFYADSASQATRSAYIGFPGAGTSDMSVTNEMTNGSLNLNTNGTGIVYANGLPLNFPRSLATNGYQVLPGGVILQWGRVNVANGNAGNVTFPITFPTACQSVQTTVLDSGTSPYTAWLNSMSASGFACRHDVPVARDVYWSAVGY